MKDNKYKPRKKAFIGAIIGAVGSIAGGIIGAKKKQKALKEQQEAERKQILQQQSLAAANANLENKSELENEFLSQYYKKYGGKVKNNYIDRNKKAIGGIGEIIGGIIQGGSAVASGVTENPIIGQAGALANGAIQSTISLRNKKTIDKLNANNDDNIVDEPIKKYGGRSMPLVVGSKGVKVKPRRV